MVYDINGYKPIPTGTTGGWERLADEAPVIGGAMGTIFDCYVIREEGIFKMWFSWRPAQAIMYTTSPDGLTWELPTVALLRDLNSDWQCEEVSRPTLVKKDGIYHMWYTGHGLENGIPTTSIGYAVSSDGIHWERPYPNPVMKGEIPWEKRMIWCPHVIYEPEEKVYKMWYSGGAQPGSIECQAIGYATSSDGIHWQRDLRNPIFEANNDCQWEMYKVSASYVWKRDGWYYMTYLGSDSDMRAQNGLARSRDGITNWERHPSNPIVAGTEGKWDCQGICKLTVIEVEDGYMGWYNGFNNTIEEMGVVKHTGFDLGFDQPNERGGRKYYPKINRVD